MLVRIGAVAAAGCLLLAACSDDDAPPMTTIAVTSVPSTASTPSTTRVPSTTVAPTTSPTTVAPTTTAAPTTTTVPAAAELTLRADGLGAVRFGADPDAVVDYVSSILGAPTTDSQWVPAFGQFGSCPGTEVRGVTWRDLTLMFGDESTVASGRRHFFAYAYGPAFGQSIDPAGMRTDDGIGIGSTVAQLRAAHPDVVLRPADQVSRAGFGLGESLNGTLTGTSDADVVQAVLGGIGCGE
jgi:hypothetical protein